MRLPIPQKWEIQLKTPGFSVFGLVYIFIFIYVLTRSIMLSITYDEAWTIADFVPLKLMHILNYTPCDANNHIINTLLIKGLYATGINSLFMARLPNIIAFAIYLFAVKTISDRLRSELLKPALVAFLILNPFVLDFFSIARGYGIALAMQALSLAFLLKYAETDKSKHYLIALISAALSVLANFTFLNFFMPVLALLLLPLLMARTKQKRARLMILSMLITASLAVISYEPLRKMVLNHNLYFGGSSGFFTDTVMSLTTASMYLHQPVKLTFYFAVAFSLVFLLCLGLIVIRNIHPRKMEGGKWQILGAEILLILAVLAALSTQLQHLLFGTLFLIERTALLFHALLFTSVCFAADRIQWKALNITLVILAVTVIINFSINANFHKTLSWDFDSRNIEILSHINSLFTKEQETCKLDYSWPFDRGINHYLNQQSFSNILSVKNPYDREACNPEAEYYLYLDREMKMVGYFADSQCIHQLRRDTLLHFKSENILLFRIYPEIKAE